MLLELSAILATPGASLPFEVEADLSDLRYGSCFPVPEPVSVSGTVRNTAGVLMLRGCLRATLHGVCDRCAGDFTRAVAIDFEAVLVSELANPEDEDENVFVMVGKSADMDEIARTVFVLNTEQKLLCRPDCRGICPRCGKNLNDGPCGCKPEPDPRFAALKQLLK
ncbi:MAG: DUF177 domain-containing protein [Firmicutes bacterium]|nr:DUF177 domain-containing protein [Bacillota bacterium]